MLVTRAAARRAGLEVRSLLATVAASQSKVPTLASLLAWICSGADSSAVLADAVRQMGELVSSPSVVLRVVQQMVCLVQAGYLEPESAAEGLAGIIRGVAGHGSVESASASFLHAFSVLHQRADHGIEPLIGLELLKAAICTMAADDATQRSQEAEEGVVAACEDRPSAVGLVALAMVQQQSGAASHSVAAMRLGIRIQELFAKAVDAFAEVASPDVRLSWLAAPLQSATALLKRAQGAEPQEICKLLEPALVQLNVVRSAVVEHKSQRGPTQPVLDAASRALRALFGDSTDGGDDDCLLAAALRQRSDRIRTMALGLLQSLRTIAGTMGLGGSSSSSAELAAGAPTQLSAIEIDAASDGIASRIIENVAPAGDLEDAGLLNDAMQLVLAQPSAAVAAAAPTKPTNRLRQEINAVARMAEYLAACGSSAVRKSDSMCVSLESIVGYLCSGRLSDVGVMGVMCI